MSLPAFLDREKMKPLKALNLLQDAGRIISDQCINLDDIAGEDHPAAIAFLTRYLHPEPLQPAVATEQLGLGI